MNELVIFILICLILFIVALSAIASIVGGLIMALVNLVCFLIPFIINAYHKHQDNRKCREYVVALADEAVYYEQLNYELNQKRKETFEELATPLYKTLRTIESKKSGRSI